jgi:hypothetical protein
MKKKRDNKKKLKLQKKAVEFLEKYNKRQKELI